MKPYGTVNSRYISSQQQSIKNSSNYKIQQNVVINENNSRNNVIKLPKTSSYFYSQKSKIQSQPVQISQIKQNQQIGRQRVQNKDMAQSGRSSHKIVQQQEIKKTNSQQIQSSKQQKCSESVSKQQIITINKQLPIHVITRHIPIFKRSAFKSSYIPDQSVVSKFQVSVPMVTPIYADNYHNQNYSHNYGTGQIQNHGNQQNQQNQYRESYVHDNSENHENYNKAENANWIGESHENYQQGENVNYDRKSYENQNKGENVNCSGGQSHVSSKKGKNVNYERESHINQNKTENAIYNGESHINQNNAENVIHNGESHENYNNGKNVNYNAEFHENYNNGENVIQNGKSHENYNNGENVNYNAQSHENYNITQNMNYNIENNENNKTENANYNIESNEADSKQIHEKMQVSQIQNYIYPTQQQITNDNQIPKPQSLHSQKLQQSQKNSQHLIPNQHQQIVIDQKIQNQYQSSIPQKQKQKSFASQSVHIHNQIDPVKQNFNSSIHQSVNNKQYSEVQQKVIEKSEHLEQQPYANNNGNNNNFQNNNLNVQGNQYYQKIASKSQPQGSFIADNEMFQNDQIPHKSEMNSNGNRKRNVVQSIEDQISGDNSQDIDNNYSMNQKDQIYNSNDEQT